MGGVLRRIEDCDGLRESGAVLIVENNDELVEVELACNSGARVGIGRLSGTNIENL